ncbi:MAG: hypothetical protein HOO04_05920 [Phycisphaerae bacterium]|nr:hypothetical protein [Phycisphaerae bacterium]
MYRSIQTIILLTLAIIVGGQSVVAEPGSTATDDGVSSAVDGASRPMRVRLSATLTKYAREVLGTEPLSVQGLSAGTSFLIDSTTLNPEAEESWRLLLDVAMLTERDDLIELALPHIVRLAPSDTTARLKRLWLAIDNANTLEKKANVISRYVSEEYRSSVGLPVASQLAMRLALLYRRSGDVERFKQWLDQAVAWDPTNLDAISLNTGLLQHLEGSDPAAWTSQLLKLYRSNPTDSSTAAELGLYLLEHGSYKAAARMLTLARKVEEAAGRDAGSDLDADLILAWWAAGENDNATNLLDERQQILDELFRQITIENADDRQSALEVAQLTAPASPKLAAIRAMLSVDLPDPTVLSDALGEAIRSTKHLDQLREAEKAPTSSRASNMRRLLWLLIVLDGPAGAIEDTALQLAALEPLNADDQALLDALTDHTSTLGDQEAALRPLAKGSSLASLALADCLEAQGRSKEAAMELLATWRRAPGTLLGVLASHRLAKMLGTNELPMSDLAQSMSVVIDTLPEVFNRFLEEPSLVVSLRVMPRTKTVSVFDPVLIDIEITNHTAEPLPVGPMGPIHELLLVQPTVTAAYVEMQPGPMVLVDIGRGLQIPAHGKLEFAMDLRSTWVGTALDSVPLHGAVVEVKAVLNVRVATARTSMMPTPIPGPFGDEFSTGEIRVDGQRVSDAWINSTLERLRESVTSRDVVDVVLLSHVVSRQDAAIGHSHITASQAGDIAAAIAEVWPRLGPLAQAWLVSSMARSDRLQSIWSLVESSSEPLVNRVALMRIASEFGDPAKALSDPAVASGLRSADRPVRMLAEWIEATLHLQAESKFGTDIDAIGGS